MRLHESEIDTSVTFVDSIGKCLWFAKVFKIVPVSSFGSIVG